MTDVVATNHGSLIGFAMRTEAADQWAKDHLPEDAQWLGRTVFVEPRYADAVLSGMRDDGLKVEGA